MPEFKAGPPKAASTITVKALQVKVKAGMKITGTKSVGGGTTKVFTDGAENYYMSDSASLRKMLATNGYPS